MHIVLFATEWGTQKGGINAFNMRFATALATVCGDDQSVTCAVQKPTAAEVRLAADSGVRLVNVDGVGRGSGKAAAQEVLARLGSERKDQGVDFWIGHDVISGFAALEAASAHGGTAALIHHMTFESYKNQRGQNGVRTLDKHEEQIELLSSAGAILFGVGSNLAASARRLGAKAKAETIIPGFPAEFTINSAEDDTLYAMVAGRFDKAAEPLKQSKLVCAALGRAVRMSKETIPSLHCPTLGVFGASKAAITRAELEKIAHDEASRFIAVNPTTFTTSSNTLTMNLARSNLAFMPSVREGFGLTGWEAIGCEVPLILGQQTGLFAFLDSVLEGQAKRYVHPVFLTGLELDERDINAMARCIIEVGEDLQYHRRRAKDLKAILKDKLAGCTWEAAASRFLHDIRAAARNSIPSGSQQSGIPVSGDRPKRLQGKWETVNHRQDCAELRLPTTMNQGDTSDCFAVLPTLHFGATEIAIKDHDVTVQIELRKAVLRVTSDTGWTDGNRLGDEHHPSPGVTAHTGNRWEFVDPDGGPLRSKLLNGAALCRIESPPNTKAHAKIEVTARKTDISYDFSPRENLQLVTQKVMKVFLDGALFKEESGHLILSTSELREEP